MRRRAECLLTVLCILALAAMVGRLDERVIGPQGHEYVSLKAAYDEWRSKQ